MNRIYLSNKIAELEFKFKGKTLCVVHPKYTAPKCPGAQFAGYKDFSENTRKLITGMDNLIMVGINKMINPGNRTEMVWEVIHNNTPDLHKIVVDTVPFLSDPWRIWFHFGAVNARFFDYTYSYIAESHYNAFVECLRHDNPFSLENVLSQSRGVMVSDYDNYFGEVTVKEKKMTKEVHSEYQQLKEKCFNEETSIKAILKRLSDFAQKACPERKVVSKSRLWDSREDFMGSYGINIVKTDLKVDDYLVSELRMLMELTNGILKGTYNG